MAGADEADSRFRLSGARQVAFMLTPYARSTTQFSVRFGREMFLTALLDVQVDKGVLILDRSGSPEVNRRFLASGTNYFSAKPEGVEVRFTAGQARETTFQGAPAFAVPIPAQAVRLQRREYFRVEVPRGKPLTVSCRMPDGSQPRLTLHDISVSGLGLTLTMVPNGLIVGTELKGCSLLLPGETQAMTFAATVRRVIRLPSRTGAQYWRAGLEFNRLSLGDETRIQRYITLLERQRRQLL